MRGRAIPIVLALIVSACMKRSARADEKPFLHPLFQNEMILQRDTLDPIWGWTEPGKSVTVSIQGKSASGVAAADGAWSVKVGPLNPGGPFELDVKGPQEAKLTGVLVGDVWLCSGQSNMEFGVRNLRNADEEISKADHPLIHLFTVPKKIAFTPQPLFRPDHGPTDAKWLVCNPQNIGSGGWGGFSAVAYFFGRDLQPEIKVPVGLIDSAWGGTVAEAWTSASGLKPVPEFDDAVKDVQSIGAGGKPKLSFDEQMDQWYAKLDPGAVGGLGWADPKLDDKDWKTVKLPARWREAGLGLEQFFGVVYLRKQVDLPAPWIGKNLMLRLGPISDRDTVWINGTKLGGSNVSDSPRNYEIASKLTQSGHLTIVVRVLDLNHGGIAGKPEELRLEPTEHAAGDATAPISLATDWKIKDAIPLVKTGIPPFPVGNDPNVVTVLYNGMIEPLLPFAIKGVIWYQGESNTDRPAQYRTILPAMIRDWRGRFGVGDFPFLIVQIAAWGDSVHPETANWAELRKAQDYASRTVGHSAIAVLTDIGETHDVHPHNKKEVGRRLMLDALAVAYGKDVEYSGPVFKQMQISGSKAVLSFDHLAGGLKSRNNAPLTGFTIAGADGKFVPASANRRRYRRRFRPGHHCARSSPLRLV